MIIAAALPSMNNLFKLPQPSLPRMLFGRVVFTSFAKNSRPFTAPSLFRPKLLGSNLPLPTYINALYSFDEDIQKIQTCLNFHHYK